MKASLCVVAFNEENFLPNLFSDFQKQSYPHDKIEIVLVNSASTDSTRQIMQDFAESNHDFAAVRVVDNPKKIQAAGWNVAIMTATGDVIFRIDAHTHIPEDFTRLNMENIKSGEFVSGGIRPCLIENDTPWSRTLLEVENSLFGSSINKCRHAHEKTYVKTMFHAAYRREVFEKVGGFNENLLRTEDNEMHWRIRNAGFRLSFDSDILSYQYARSDFKKMLKQKFGNGEWIGLTMGVCPGCVSPFHLVPFCFVGGILGTTVLCGFGIWELAALMWGLYGAFAVVNTAVSIKNEGFELPKLLMPAMFLALHTSYGVGTAVGLCKMPFERKKLADCKMIDEVKKVLSANQSNQSQNP